MSNLRVAPDAPENTLVSEQKKGDNDVLHFRMGGQFALALVDLFDVQDGVFF